MTVHRNRDESLRTGVEQTRGRVDAAAPSIRWGSEEERDAARKAARFVHAEGPLEKLVAELAHDDFDTREQASAALRSSKEPRVVELLLAAAKSPDAEQRRRAGELLTEMREAELAKTYDRWAAHLHSFEFSERDELAERMLRQDVETIRKIHAKFGYTSSPRDVAQRLGAAFSKLAHPAGGDPYWQCVSDVEHEGSTQSIWKRGGREESFIIEGMEKAWRLGPPGVYIFYPMSNVKPCQLTMPLEPPPK